MNRQRINALVAHLLRACCVLLVACSGDDGGDEALAPVDLWPLPSAGHPHRAPVSDAGPVVTPPPRQPTDWTPIDPVEPGTDAGDDDAGPPMDPDPALALFDPDEVYLLGALTPGASSLAIAPVLAPNDALVGFGPYSSGNLSSLRPSDGRLLYWDNFAPEGVYAFHCDGCVYFRGDYPADPRANDEPVSTVCEDPPPPFRRFVVTPAGDTLVQCGEQIWLDEAGAEVAALAGRLPLKVGHQDTALLADGVLHLMTGAVAPLTGPVDFTVLATRTREDGYFIATQPNDSTLPSELWLAAFDGTATLLGTYPALPALHRPSSGAELDGAGRLFQIVPATNPESDTIIRRTVDGDSEVVYDEADRPVVTTFGAALVTGP